MRLSRHSCEQILKQNDRGTFTVPSARLYPHQWAWDSAFAAVGWARISGDRAWAELRSLLAGQWPDGRIPHIQFHDLSGDYFPGPDFWETERSTSISQPPVWATCARKVLELCGPCDDLRDLVQRIDASHRFFATQRDPLKLSLCAVVHPWESGMDNSPAWDAPLSRIDPSLAPPFHRRDTKFVADASERPTDDNYKRYAVLVKAIAKEGFGPGPFAVYDPFFTAILARAESDLAVLAKELGVESKAFERSQRLRKALDEHLWRGDLGRYVYLDATTREPILTDVIGCYTPLWSGVSEDKGARLRQGLETKFMQCSYPLPSTAPGDPAFEPRRYWRGPSWICVNWMFCEALGSTLLNSTLALVEKAGFFEYFDAHTGAGLGGDNFTWTAALALDLLARQPSEG